MDAKSRKEYLQAEFLGEMKEIAKYGEIDINDAVDAFMVMWEWRSAVKNLYDSTGYTYFAAEFWAGEMTPATRQARKENPVHMYKTVLKLASCVMVFAHIERKVAKEGLVWQPQSV